jgi:hypothetical protein
MDGSHSGRQMLQVDLEINSPFAYRLKRQGGRLSKQSVAKKAKQREEALGMPYGTAFSRLRKLVLFDCSRGECVLQMREGNYLLQRDVF